MIRLRCPKCGSSRIRPGYTRAPIWLRVLFIQDLLCDGCNLTYRGFAPPGSLRRARRRMRRYRHHHHSRSENTEERKRQ
jgi:hypothetical protein